MVNKLSWLNEFVINKCLKDEEYSVDEINITGSWECGKTYACIETCCKSSLGNKVGTVLVRNSKYQMEELYSSTLDYLVNAKISYIKESDESGYRTIRILPSQNIFRFIYAERKTKKANESLFSGLRPFLNYKKINIFIDEAFELTEEQKKTLISKVRGDKQTQILLIQCCNPYNISNEYVKYCSKNLAYNQFKLKTYGYDMTSLDFTKANKKIFAYINPIATPEIMNINKWRRINEACARSRDKALTIKFGIPSYDNSSEYGTLIEKISKPMIKEITQICCGCDVGGGTNRNAGITACMMGFYTPGIGIDFFKEYTHDNKIVEKPITQRANEIIDYVMEQIIWYRNQTKSPFPLPFVNINVDLSNYDFISRLNEVIHERNLSNRMSARRNRKNDFQISERINYTKDWVFNRKLRIDFEKCPILYEEFSSMKLIVSNNEMEPVKRQTANDHVINAMEYAMEDIWEVEKMKTNTGIIRR